MTAIHCTNVEWPPPPRAQRLKQFNLAWKSQSRLKLSILKTNGGWKRIIGGGGPKPFLGRGFMVCFPRPWVFHPPLFFSEKRPQNRTFADHGFGESSPPPPSSMAAIVPASSGPFAWRNCIGNGPGKDHIQSFQWAFVRRGRGPFLSSLTCQFWTHGDWIHSSGDEPKAQNWFPPRSFWSRVLDAEHSLDFYPYRRASRFVAFQTKVAHLCFCLVRVKMPLLTWKVFNDQNSTLIQPPPPFLMCVIFFEGGQWPSC